MKLTFLFISLVSGFLSVLAPCVIGLLPLLVGQSAKGERLKKALRIITGLSVSIFTFTLLLKASTVLISVPTKTWQLISGIIIILFGLSSLLPKVWEWLSLKLNLNQLSSKTQIAANKRGGRLGDFLLGASLGPIFNSCSPTYALIVAVILPSSKFEGLTYLIVFIAGLALSTLAVTLLGSKLISKLNFSLNPHGWFRRILGIIFIMVGLSIIFGLDKTILSWLVENGWFDWQVSLENKLNN